MTFRVSRTSDGLVWEMKRSETILHPTNPNFDDWHSYWSIVPESVVPESIREGLLACMAYPHHHPETALINYRAKREVYDTNGDLQ